MTVIIKKDFLDYKAGDEVDVTDARGLYWLRCGVATVGQPSKEEVDSKLEKTLKKAKPKKR